MKHTELSSLTRLDASFSGQRQGLPAGAGVVIGMGAGALFWLGLFALFW